MPPHYLAGGGSYTRAVSHADFLTRCAAEPFRAFRVHTVDGQSFDVGLRSQVAVSPEGRMIVIVLSDARFEVLVPERIARCEVLIPGMGPAPIEQPPTAGASPTLSPGGISFIAFTGIDGRKVVQFVATDADGNPMLTSAGTRWDIYAMEVFENGRTLYLQHLDDLNVMQRVILWPPRQGTCESFAEAMDVGDLQAGLLARSELSKSKGFAMPRSYWKSIEPAEPYVPPMPKAPHRVTGMRSDDPNRFAMSALRYEAAPGEFAIGAALEDIFTEHVMFDLHESGWNAKIKDDVAKWDLTLTTVAAPGKEVRLHIDAFKGEARVEEAWLSLEAAERHLRNFPLHGSWESLMGLLTGEPRDPRKPEVVLPMGGGARLEFWPGKTGISAPYLTVRIVDGNGRTVLDGRGSEWGAMARVTAEKGSGPLGGGTVSMNLLHAKAENRLGFTPRLVVDLGSHRVMSEAIEGWTSVEVLQKALHTCRTVEWMMEEMGEWFGRSKGLPAC